MNEATKTTSEKPSRSRVRRVPQQQRSREKVQRVLDAADALLVHEGADALATTRVAEVARVSIGSVYSYFPDKEAIAEALALRYWSEFLRRVKYVVAVDEREPLADPIGALLDAVADGFRQSRGFRAMWFGGLRSERVRNVTRPARDEFGAVVDRVLAIHWPKSTAEDRAVAAGMTVLVADSALREAFRLSPEGEPNLLAEVRRVIVAYLDDRLG